MIKVRFSRRRQAQRRRKLGVLDGMVARVIARPASDVEKETAPARPSVLADGWRRPRVIGSTH